MISLTEASIVSLLTFGLGVLMGHQLTLLRDRRQEFNAAARPIREWLLKVILQPDGNWPKPGVGEMHEFTSRLSQGNRVRFADAIDRYLDSWDREHVVDEKGFWGLRNAQPVVEAAKEALKFTKLR